jgi:hypothetical protein
VSETKERKVVGKSIVIVLGIACMILVASLVGAFAYYVPMVNSKNSTISSLNSQIANLQNQTASDNLTMVDLQNQIDSLQSQIAQLQENASSQNATIANLQNQLASDNSTIYSSMSNITTLQNMLSSFSNETAWVSLDEVWTYPNYLKYVNRTIAVEGNLTGPLVYIPENMPPWSYEWVNPDGTLHHDFGVSGIGGTLNSTHVIVIGVVKEGRRAGGDIPPEIVYYIEAERIDIL